ncbi:MAG: ABC transporter permease, partial [Lachnospiraceae bacterium]|nr:ABC transporter permease [Lachnospiraceae bacterium]
MKSGRILRKKLLRTFGVYKAQFLSMIIMIALGIGVFIGFNMEWFSLEKDTSFIFEQTGFADFRIYSEEGFSAQDLQKVRDISGVRDATRFLSVNASVKDDTDVVAIAVTENEAVSGMYLVEGEPYDPESPDGLWLSDQYAAQNQIALGDELTLTYKMLTVTGTVKGLVKASEFLICLPDETQLMPDFHSYGFAYMSPVMLQEIIPVIFRKMAGDNLYYQINVLTDLDKGTFVEQVDQALGKTLLVLSKDETVSYHEAMGEIDEGKTMGSILPVLFLAIAVLTMVTTMHRITASEKTQIGTLKALGFRNRRILLHYTSYALFVGIAGSALGIGIGYGLGWYIMNPGGAMGTYIDMPKWTLYVPWFCWIILAGVILFLVLIGFLSVRSILKGSAAATLQPYTPKNMRHLAIEETGLFKRLDFGTKWNLRDCFRHKARSFMTLFGIAGCMILLVGAMGMNDTMDAFVSSFYEDAIRYESRINLDMENADNEETHAIAQQYEGDYSGTDSVQVGDKAIGLEIYHITHDLVCFTDENMNTVHLTDTGAYICHRIAKEWNLSPGDTIRFSPYGSDATYEAVIEGVLRSMSESIVMTDTYADTLGIDYTINTVYTNAQASDIAEGTYILNVQTRKAIMDSFDSFLELMIVMIVLLVIAAVVLSLVVLYNLGVMSYTERYREMATLKVIGFRNRKIANLLITQNLWLSILGILIGLPAGIGVLQYLLDALASEYEMKLTLGPATYLVSILLTLGVS